MKTTAVVLEEPRSIALRTLGLTPARAEDVGVAVDWTGISTGTERLLYAGEMPSFPGMGYPLVPGYEAVGRVTAPDAAGAFALGDRVFVPGATCFDGARGLFGASASHLVVPAARIVKIDEFLGSDAVMLALAATAYHTFAQPGAEPPELIVGHGVLGRLLARIVIAMGGQAPTVWETNRRRMAGAEDYVVVDPAEDPRSDYRRITDVSGDSAILDTLVGRLAPGGEIVLAGFYKAPLAFAFPPAFMREAHIRIAAQWQRADIELVARLATTGALSLSGLATHQASAEEAPRAYAAAFDDPDCLKMVIDWRGLA